MGRAIFGLILAAILSSSANAKSPCDAFKIKLKNNLAEDLTFTTINLHGAKILPNNTKKLIATCEQSFLVNKSTPDLPIQGEFILESLSFPVKKIKIMFNLKSIANKCIYRDNSSINNDYIIQHVKNREFAKYSINRK
ncbi:MAG: hypothetical protein H0U70_05495 [Tatlockia sp.]|nr:hypothetical protein [Tatlockia sp.]